MDDFRGIMLWEIHPACTMEHVDAIVEALKAAGYSIVHESEIHGATKERCEEIALAEVNKCLDKSNAAMKARSRSEMFRHNTAFHAVSSVADAIRALPDGAQT